MAHAISASSTRYDHMSPVAAALAAMLHAATALALIWVAPRHLPEIDENNAIDVTIEQPQPPAVQPPAAQPAPPPPPAAAQKLQPQPQPQRNLASKEQLGLPPEGPVEPDKKPEAKLEPKPEPPAEPKPEPPKEAAARPAEPTPAPTPEKPLEKVLPPVEQPAAPLSMHDFVKVLPPPPAPPPSPPVQRPPPPQQHPPQHAQRPQPSPLSQRPPPQDQRQASVSAFQNPAGAYNRARVHDDYLISIARKMSQYRFVPRSLKGLNTQGVVVLSLVVSRDGKLLSSAIAKSSGNPPMDRAVLETAQKAAPYGPLPREISGGSATFLLSVPYKFIAEQ